MQEQKERLWSCFAHVPYTHGSGLGSSRTGSTFESKSSNTLSSVDESASTAPAAMAVKTDRNDARAIAQAMRVGWFTAVHVKTAESQELRLLLTNRKTLLTSRVTLENEIRGTLKAFGLKVGRDVGDASGCSSNSRHSTSWCSMP